jgi:hypothetical protein
MQESSTALCTGKLTIRGCENVQKLRSWNGQFRSIRSDSYLVYPHQAWDRFTLLRYKQTWRGHVMWPAISFLFPPKQMGITFLFLNYKAKFLIWTWILKRSIFISVHSCHVWLQFGELGPRFRRIMAWVIPWTTLKCSFRFIFPL